MLKTSAVKKLLSQRVKARYGIVEFNVPLNIDYVILETGALSSDMCSSHSVMEGQRHNNPLNPHCFCFQRPKRDEVRTHAIVEAAKAIGGSFKLVTLTPKTVREMTQLPRET